MPLILGAQSAVATGFAVDNSCRFNDDDSAYLSRSQGTPTGSGLKATVSLWLKPSYINPTTNSSGLFEIRNAAINASFDIGFDNGAFFAGVLQGSWIGYLVPNMLFRDWSAWYHICFVYDSAQSNDYDRMVIYINGKNVRTDLGGYSTETYVSQSTAVTALAATSGYDQQWGRYAMTGASVIDGYMAECVFIDGEAYAPSDFGEFDEDSPTIWKPKNPSTLTFGDQGCYLEFGDSAALGDDTSGNTNDFTSSGLAAVDQCTDSPTNNFATWNPLARNPSDTGSLAEGNTAYTISSNAYNTKSTLAMTAGKWYWEQKATLINARVGVNTSQANNNKDSDDGSFYWGSTGNGGTHTVTATDSTNWQLTNNDTSSNISTLPGTAISYTAGDIVMIALDVDTGKMWYGLNGTWFNSGDPGAGTTPVVTITNGSPDPFMVNGSSGSGSSSTITANFGNPPFAITSSNADGNGYGNFDYAVPTGFYALCTKNLAEFG